MVKTFWQCSVLPLHSSDNSVKKKENHFNRDSAPVIATMAVLGLNVTIIEVHNQSTAFEVRVNHSQTKYQLTGIQLDLIQLFV